jgi:hypothetical protein
MLPVSSPEVLRRLAPFFAIFTLHHFFTSSKTLPLDPPAAALLPARGALNVIDKTSLLRIISNETGRFRPQTISKLCHVQFVAALFPFIIIVMPINLPCFHLSYFSRRALTLLPEMGELPDRVIECFAAVGAPARMVARLPLFTRYLWNGFLSPWPSSDYPKVRYGKRYKWRLWLLFDIREVEMIETLINNGSNDSILAFHQSQLLAFQMVAIIVSHQKISAKEPRLI